MRKLILALSLTLALILPVQQAHAIFGFSIVFDPRNFAQNLLTASRSMMMIRNQITSLQNEVRMLDNMRKNLRPLGLNSIPDLQRTLAQMNLIIQNAEGMAIEISTIESRYQALYPEEYSAALTHDQYVGEAHERWQYSRAAFADSLKTQAGIIASLREDEDLWQELVQASQTSEGAMQVDQVTNQMLALRAQQEVKSQQLMVMHYRAVALEQARRLAEKEKARAMRGKFLGDGESYTPIPITIN